MTVLDLITRSLRIIGWLQPGEVPSMSVAGTVLVAANSLIGSLNLDRNNIFTIQEQTVNLVPGQQDYLIGPGAPDFSLPRPEKIEPANLVIQTSPLLTRPLKLLNYQQWAAIPLKSVASIPLQLYYDYGYSQPAAQPATAGMGWAGLHFYPLPSGVYQAQLFCWLALAQLAGGSLANLNWQLALPEGYDRMLAYLIAAEIAPDFGRTLTPESLAIAKDAWQAVQSKNAPSPLMPSEQAFGHNRKTSFSYLIGE